MNCPLTSNLTAFRRVLCASTGSGILAGTGYGVYKIATREKTYTYDENTKTHEELNMVRYQEHLTKSKIQLGLYSVLGSMTGVLTSEFIKDYVKDVRNAKSCCNIIGRSMLHQPVILLTFAGSISCFALAFMEYDNMSKIKKN